MRKISTKKADKKAKRFLAKRNPVIKKQTI